MTIEGKPETRTATLTRVQRVIAICLAFEEQGAAGAQEEALRQLRAVEAAAGARALEEERARFEAILLECNSLHELCPTLKSELRALSPPPSSAPQQEAGKEK